MGDTDVSDTSTGAVETEHTSHILEPSATPLFCLITLGCAKNEVDSNHMRALLAASRLRETGDPAAADVVIINTCSFITEATEESLDAIFETLSLENFKQGRARLVVAGCMPSRYGEELKKELFEAAAFVTVSDEERIVEICYEVLGIPWDHEQDERFHGMATCDHFDGKTLALSARRIIDGPWAYVKISDGCSRQCSYCTIPQIRGPYHSRPFEAIALEVEELVAGGVCEIILIGQDTSVWGSDLCCKDDNKQYPQAKTLACLLSTLATTHPTVWFRVMYLQPQGITDALLETIARHRNICDYLDIPLQHVNARILQEMNRSGSAEEFYTLLSRIRSILPDATIRTTLIAGFPGETQAEARELEDFVNAADFDYVGVFAYSQEDGTPAGKRVDQVPLRTRKARQQRLRDAADKLGFRRAERKFGTMQEVLICGVDEEGVYGRIHAQAPDIDGVTHIQGAQIDPDDCPMIIRVEITASNCYDLYANLSTNR